MLCQVSLVVWVIKSKTIKSFHQIIHTERGTGMKHGMGYLGLGVLFALTVGASEASAGTVGILESTVSGGYSSVEAQAVVALGHTPIMISPGNWQFMAEYEFATFDALILGDPTCRVGTSSVAAAAANPAWAQAADGKVIIIGTDPTYHYSHAGAQALVRQGIAFALAEAGSGKTGAYVTLSCYYHMVGANTYAEFLRGFGDFLVVGASTTGALNNVRIVASHPALAGITNALLSNWGNSVHQSFGVAAQSWPSDFEVLAVAAGAGGNFVAPDGTRGYPYILARGIIPDSCGDGSLGATEECDDGNNVDGDGCDQSCNVEESCLDSDGDTVCDLVDACVGDDLSGDSDSDFQCDNVDLCPFDFWNDWDADGVCGDVDNCPFVSNSGQDDADSDNLGDVCDDDDDNDGVPDATDNCQYDSNPSQLDHDGDGAGNVCDADSDGDGVIDAQDACLPTDMGAAVDGTGCSLAQLCPCESNWKNHGAYVSCNARQSSRFVANGWMTEAQKGAWMSSVGGSTCGK